MDLIDINFYSILNSNSSYIIIYDDKKDENNKIQCTIKQKDDINEEEEASSEKKQYISFFRFKDNEVELMDNVNDFNIKIEEKIKNKDIKYKDFDLGYLEDFRDNYIINNYKFGCLADLWFEDISPEKDFDDDEVKIFFYKILKIVQFMHNNNLNNLDLDLENILLDENYNPILLYSEIARKNSEKKGYNFEIISRYSPPELFSNSLKYDGFKIDIFRLGVLLFELLFRKRPFRNNITQCQFYDLIKKRHYETFWGVHNIKDKEQFKYLFIKMVAFDYKERLSIEEILNSPWMIETNELIKQNSDQINDLIKKTNEKFQKKKNKINIF